MSEKPPQPIKQEDPTGKQEVGDREHNARAIAKEILDGAEKVIAEKGLSIDYTSDDFWLELSTYLDNSKADIEHKIETGGMRDKLSPENVIKIITISITVRYLSQIQREAGILNAEELSMLERILGDYFHINSQTIENFRKFLSVIGYERYEEVARLNNLGISNINLYFKGIPIRLFSGAKLRDLDKFGQRVKHDLADHGNSEEAMETYIKYSLGVKYYKSDLPESPYDPYYLIQLATRRAIIDRTQSSEFPTLDIFLAECANQRPADLVVKLNKFKNENRQLGNTQRLDELIHLADTLEMSGTVETFLHHSPKMHLPIKGVDVGSVSVPLKKELEKFDKSTEPPANEPKQDE